MSWLEKELQSLGLTDKEAKVYLAGLELGPSPVQKISIKAGVNRPTTYVMIENLSEKGLMSSFEKGKKRYFTAEKPNQFLDLINDEKETVSKKEEVVKKILADLNSLGNRATERPKVSFYEGMEGVHALREEVIKSKARELFEIVPVDLVRKYIAEEAPPDDLRHKIRKNFSIRSIYTSKNGPIYNKKINNIESRYLSPNNFPADAEIIIFGDKTAFFTFLGKPTGILLQNAEVTKTMKLLFENLWLSAK